MRAESSEPWWTEKPIDHSVDFYYLVLSSRAACCCIICFFYFLIIILDSWSSLACSDTGHCLSGISPGVVYSITAALQNSCQCYFLENVLFFSRPFPWSYTSNGDVSETEMSQLLASGVLMLTHTSSIGLVSFWCGRGRKIWQCGET